MSRAFKVTAEAMHARLVTDTCAQTLYIGALVTGKFALSTNPVLSTGAETSPGAITMVSACSVRQTCWS